MPGVGRPALVVQRGNPLDYERWAADAGMADSDYAHCLPYFKRMENCLAAAQDDPFRGHTGPLVLERGPATNPLFGAFFAAVQQAGYQLTDDVNGYRQEGFAPFDRNVHRGRRLSAARAYLYPVMSRPDLTVATRAFVTKIIFDGTRAVGVEFRHEGKTKRVRSDELILCGGAINSPQLLQLSGSVTPAALRARHRRGRRPARCGRDLRTTWRCTFSTARSCQSRSRPRSSGATAPWSARSGCSCAPGPGPPTISRAAASPAATMTSSTRT